MPAPDPIAFWNARYSEDELAYGDRPNDFLLETIRAAPGAGRALEVASGQGRNAVFLAQQGWDVTAVDASAAGTDRALALAEARGVRVDARTANLAEFAIEPESWDLAVAIFAHLPPPLRARVHAALVVGLRPGGRLVLEAYTPEQLELKTGGPPVREMLLSLEQAKRELAGLRFEVAREVRRVVREGRYHDGEAAVVQVIGVKE